MNYEESVILKNDKGCTLRALTREDGQITYDAFNEMHRESVEFLTSYEDENSFSSEQEAEVLDTWLHSTTDLQIGAFVDKKLVGMAGFHPIGLKDKVKHRCDFGITVLQSHHSLGIGKALTVACLTAARQAGYKQMELEVVASNAKAYSLYKACGFEEFGRNPLGFITREGKAQ